MGGVVTTVAIIDFAHSGTTMLAGLCEVLGVPMVNRRYKPMKWEDLEIVSALQDEEQFIKLVAERNRKHAVWGFKYCGAWKFEPLLTRHLRAPVYLAIYKEPVSVTWRRFGKCDIRKVMDTVEQFQTSLAGLKAMGQPVYLFSYLKTVLSPLDTVLRLTRIIGIRPNNGQIDAAVQFIRPNDTETRRPYPEVAAWI